ncbi:MAG: PEP-CTERM sorting domain-containing protein [bacterium]|nr:PEP-CTERM sorting domain-containing protein [bacterium]
MLIPKGEHECPRIAAPSASVVYSYRVPSIARTPRARLRGEPVYGFNHHHRRHGHPCRGAYRRGGSYSGYDINSLASSSRYGSYPGQEAGGQGFRVACEVPEPCSLVLLSLGGLLATRRRR